MSSPSFSRMSQELAERFEREAMPYQTQLLRTAMQMTRHRQDAEDLVQEAIARACAGFGGYTAGTNLKAWLHRIMLNAFINGYRKRQRKPILAIASAEQLQAYAQHSSASGYSPSAEECALSRRPASELLDALRELPLDFRQVVYLIDVEGFSYRETAAIMNTPLGTVMSRLHRARTTLRTRLARADNRVFELPEQGERMGNRNQEVPHVQRDNGSDHRCGDNGHRGDHCQHNGKSPTAAAAAIRPRI